MDGGTLRGATFDASGRYRYTLWRRWAGTGQVAFVMLNPSTADACRDDPTIRRCLGFARAWGFGALTVVNLYAFRATRPADLFATVDPAGPENDLHIIRTCGQADLVVAGWGCHGRADRVARVLPLLASPPYCLGRTAAGAPRHPLYLRRDTALERFA